MALSYNSASFTEHSFGIPTFDEVENIYTNIDNSNVSTTEIEIVNNDSTTVQSILFAFGASTGAGINRVIYRLRDRVVGVVDFKYSGTNLTNVKRVL